MIGSICLERINSNGKTQLYELSIDGNSFTSRWGVKDGKVQERTSVVNSGKNLGRANATTPEEQALKEASTKINKKVDEKYQVVQASGCLVSFLSVKATLTPQPMLANSYSIGAALTKLAFIQPKLDGIRCLANTITGELYSRKGKIILGVPHISKSVIEAKKMYPLLPEWLDGELYNHDLSFQEIVSLVRPTVNVKDSSKIKYWIYDCISDDCFSDRLDLISQISGLDDLVIVSTDSIENIDHETIDKFHDSYAELDYEGVIVRNNAPYLNKRTSNLLKYKKFQQEEFQIVDFEKEEYDEILGAIVCISGANLFKARPAMTDEERKDLWVNKESYKQSYVATVKFQELTDDGIPRFPVCLGIRHNDDR